MTVCSDTFGFAKMSSDAPNTDVTGRRECVCVGGMSRLSKSDATLMSESSKMTYELGRRRYSNLRGI